MGRHGYRILLEVALCICCLGIFEHFQLWQHLNTIKTDWGLPQGDNTTQPTNHEIMCTGTKSRAIIHAGIHKTGTSSIQHRSSELVKELRMDGYEMPWALANATGPRGPKLMKESQVNFATCFLPDTHRARIRYPCDPNLLLYGSEISANRRNLFISTEELTKLDNEGGKMLAAYLDQWEEVTIVIYHRRFYSYIRSNFYESKAGQEKRGKAFYPNIVEFLSDPIVVENVQNIYTPNVLKRLQVHFRNIIVMDFHDQSKGDSVVSFYCHAMPNATRTCKAIRSQRQNERSNVRYSKDQDYKDLLEAATKAGLTTKSKTGMELTKALQNHHEKNLNRTTADFPRICPPLNVLDMVWNVTLESERTLFPSRFEDASLGTESRLRTELCYLDFDTILGEQTWLAFFQSLNPASQ